MDDIDPDNLREKQRIELAAATSFLQIYNLRKGTNYDVVGVQDTPDVRCQDRSSQKVLVLEITLLEDHPDDIAYVLGRVDVKDELSITRVIDFRRDVIPRLVERLKDKLLSVYGEKTALLIRQVGTLWTISDWQREAATVVSQVLAGRERHYGMGVWILCSNTSTIPVSNDLFPLFDLILVLLSGNQLSSQVRDWSRKLLGKTAPRQILSNSQREMMLMWFELTHHTVANMQS